jgi:hypothetical protein
VSIVPEQRDADHPGVAAPRGERSAYGAQPSATERPVPVRHSDEAPTDAAQWDSSSTEPSRPRGTDDVKDDRVRAERDSRADLAAASDTATTGSAGDDESSYSSEREQGAAQPGTPDTAEDTDESPQEES